MLIRWHCLCTSTRWAPVSCKIRYERVKWLVQASPVIYSTSSFRRRGSDQRTPLCSTHIWTTMCLWGRNGLSFISFMTANRSINRWITQNVLSQLCGPDSVRYKTIHNHGNDCWWGWISQFQVGPSDCISSQGSLSRKNLSTRDPLVKESFEKNDALFQLWPGK